MSLQATSALPSGIQAAVERRWGRKAAVGFAVRTGTKVDVGEWFTRGTLWLLISDRDGERWVLLAASGARPVQVALPAQELEASVYNHVTGELVLAPATRSPIRALRLSPAEARRVLAALHHGPGSAQDAAAAENDATTASAPAATTADNEASTQSPTEESSHA